MERNFGPFFFGGTHQMLAGTLGVLEQLEQAFRDGGGVPQASYRDHFWCGLSASRALGLSTCLCKSGLQLSRKCMQNYKTEPRWLTSAPSRMSVAVGGGR